MTEFEKMRSGLLYRFDDEEVLESVRRANYLCAKLQTLTLIEDECRNILETYSWTPCLVWHQSSFPLRPRTWYCDGRKCVCELQRHYARRWTDYHREPDKNRAELSAGDS